MHLLLLLLLRPSPRRLELDFTIFSHLLSYDGSIDQAMSSDDEEDGFVDAREYQDGDEQGENKKDDEKEKNMEKERVDRDATVAVTPSSSTLFPLLN